MDINWKAFLVSTADRRSINKGEMKNTGEKIETKSTGETIETKSTGEAIETKSTGEAIETKSTGEAIEPKFATWTLQPVEESRNYSTYACERCTYYNKITADKCKLCEHVRSPLPTFEDQLIDDDCFLNDEQQYFSRF